jgi:hypothetical protein
VRKQWIARREMKTRRQETLLAVTGQVGDPLYSSTREAVLTLKHPIRRIDTKAVHQMDTCYINDGNRMIDMKWGTKRIKQE